MTTADSATGTGTPPVDPQTVRTPASAISDAHADAPAGVHGDWPPAGPDRHFDRSVAFWLRAYPRRWRAARAAEITAVLTDLAEPGARRLDARAALGLVRGGWATRWREHPPLHTYLAYRLVELPIPAKYRDWAQDELTGSLYGVRLAMAGLWFVAPIVAFTWSQAGRPPSGLIWFVLFLAGATAFGTAPHRRRELLRKHLAPRFGEVLTAGDLVYGLVPRRRHAARPVLVASTVLLGVAAVAWTAAALTAPTALWTHVCATAPADGPLSACTKSVVGPAGGLRTVAAGGVVLATLVGFALVPLVVRRLRRLLPLAPAQPARSVEGISTAGWVSVGFWAGTIGVEAWMEASGRLVLGVSGVGAALALVALPGVLAASWVLRRGSVGERAGGAGGAGAIDVAAVDVRRVILRARIPNVDERAAGLVPVAGTDLVGTVVQQPVVINPAPAPRYARTLDHGAGGRR